MLLLIHEVSHHRFGSVFENGLPQRAASVGYVVERCPVRHHYLVHSAAVDYY